MAPQATYEYEINKPVDINDPGYRTYIENRAQDLIHRREHVYRPETLPQEYEDNARTALLEAMTASGHLSVIEISGTIDEINQQILSRLVNGFEDSLPEHEKQRRYEELCNELYIQDIHKKIISGELAPATEVLEISDYPDALDQDTATSIGYRWRNQKGMLRSTSLRYEGEGKYTRVIEQVSRSQAVASETANFLMASGVRLNNKQHRDLSVLATPFLIDRRNYREGVVDIVRALDKYKGPNILYGDNAQRSLKHVSYDELRVESQRREAEIQNYFGSLAETERLLDIDLKRGLITKDQHRELYVQKVENILCAVCTLRPEYAEDTFGSDSVEQFTLAADFVASGNIAAAQELLETNKHLRNEITFCGMSSEQTNDGSMNLNTFAGLLKVGLEGWVWKRGRCRIDNCPNSKRAAEIGPCDVCKDCQRIFDQQKDPKKVYKAVNKSTGFVQNIIDDIKADKKH